MHFFRPTERIEDYPFTLADGTVISTNPEPPAKSIRILGLNLDQRLSWAPHVNIQATKCRKALFALRKAQGQGWGMSARRMKVVYQALIASVMFFGVELWAHTLLGPQASTHNRNTVSRILSLASRLVTKASRTAATKATLALSGIPPLHLQVPQLLATRYLLF